MGAAAADFGGDRLGILRPGDVVDHHIGAGVAEREGDGLADPELAPVTRAFCPFNNLMIEQAGMAGSGNVSWTNLASKLDPWRDAQRRRLPYRRSAGCRFISQKRRFLCVGAAMGA